MGTQASGRSIINPHQVYYTYQCQTNEILRIYVQPLPNGLTNIEMVNMEEDCPVQQSTEADSASVFAVFDTYMKWMD